MRGGLILFIYFFHFIFSPFIFAVPLYPSYPHQVVLTEYDDEAAQELFKNIQEENEKRCANPDYSTWMGKPCQGLVEIRDCQSMRTKAKAGLIKIIEIIEERYQADPSTRESLKWYQAILSKIYQAIVKAYRASTRESVEYDRGGGDPLGLT